MSRLSCRLTCCCLPPGGGPYPRTRGPDRREVHGCRPEGVLRAQAGAVWRHHPAGGPGPGAPGEEHRAPGAHHHCAWPHSLQVGPPLHVCMCSSGCEGIKCPDAPFTHSAMAHEAMLHARTLGCKVRAITRMCCSKQRTVMLTSHAAPCRRCSRTILCSASQMPAGAHPPLVNIAVSALTFCTPASILTNKTLQFTLADTCHVICVRRVGDLQTQPRRN